MVKGATQSRGSWLACEEEHAVFQVLRVKGFAGKPAPTVIVWFSAVAGDKVCGAVHSVCAPGVR